MIANIEAAANLAKSQKPPVDKDTILWVERGCVTSRSLWRLNEDSLHEALNYIDRLAEERGLRLKYNFGQRGEFTTSTISRL